MSAAWGAAGQDEVNGMLWQLLELYLAGHIRPQVADILPLDQAPEAIARLGRRELTGKIAAIIASDI